jgi:hypothetical protein
MKKTVAVLSILMLTLTACGGGADEQEAKDNLRTSFSEDDSLAGADEEQAGCVADGMVDELGVEKLQEYNILDDDLQVNEDPGDVEMSEEDADQAAEIVIDCVDTAEMFTSQMEDSEEGLTDEQKDCIEAAIDDDAMKEMLSAEFQGKESNAMDDMTGEIMACLLGDMQLPEESPTE